MIFQTENEEKRFTQSEICKLSNKRFEEKLINIGLNIAISNNYLTGDPWKALKERLKSNFSLSFLHFCFNYFFKRSFIMMPRITFRKVWTHCFKLEGHVHLSLVNACKKMKNNLERFNNEYHNLLPNHNYNYSFQRSFDLKEKSLRWKEQQLQKHRINFPGFKCYKSNKWRWKKFKKK